MLTHDETKAREIAEAWETRHCDYEEWLDSKLWEVQDMWDEREGNYALNDYLHSTYRNGPLPEDWRRYLRNDPVADYEETFVLRD